MKAIVDPCARGIVQGLIDATKNLQTAVDKNDLPTAIKILRRGAELCRQLLPKLTEPELHQAYLDTLNVNI